MNNQLRHLKRHLKEFWIIGLCILVSHPLVPPALAQNLPSRIELVVVEGEGAVHRPGQHSAGKLVVRVEDDDHRPLAGASVVFALPISGASGEFGNGSTNLTAVTDKDGLAVAYGMRANQIAGKLLIYVTTSYRGLRAKALINQAIEGSPTSAKTPDMRSQKSGGKWKWVALGVLAASGAAGGVYFGTRNNSPAAPISITAGAVTFGSPR